MAPSCPDQRARLAGAIGEAVAAAEGEPFAWGRSDCLTWLANIYRAALGIDPAKPWRGRYRSERGAQRVLGKRGVFGAVRKAARSQGWQRIAPASAQVGDLGLVMTAQGLAGVIFDGAMWLGRVPDGFSASPTARVVRAWRVV